jgi:adrenodoxin-NADP+ reductase
VDDVRNEYSAVVVATGANGDRDLGIDGEGLFGVSSARKFVNWYNGYPFGYDQATEEFQKLIRMSDTAVIVGQGNVAIDVARILLSPIERLKHTDICRDALDALKLSSIRKVYLVGRRGPVQV